MQIKVSSTKNHEVMEHGKGNLTHDTIKTVAEGKLVLIETYSGGGRWIEISGRLKKPIIISETEKIEIGDWYLTFDWLSGKVIGDVRKCEDTSYSFEHCRKVLALPKHFSPEQLQMIVDGRLNDGDKVLVECEKWFNQDAEIGSDWGHKSIEMKVKLDSQSHITLYPVEEKKETECTLGVGDGAGQLFVHGSYEAIKILQAKLLKMEKMYTREEIKNILVEWEKYKWEAVRTPEQLNVLNYWFERNIK